MWNKVRAIYLAFVLMSFGENIRAESLEQDLKDIRKAVQEGVSCPLSFPTPPVPCPSTFVTLKSKTGAPLVAATGTTYGRWKVRARCTPTGIEVKAARPKDPNLPVSIEGPPELFQGDETGKAMDWNYRPIFSAGTAPCHDLFGASAPNQPISRVLSGRIDRIAPTHYSQAERVVWQESASKQKNLRFVAETVQIPTGFTPRAVTCTSRLNGHPQATGHVWCDYTINGKSGVTFEIIGWIWRGGTLPEQTIPSYFYDYLVLGSE